MSKFLNVGLPTVLENHTELLNIDMDPTLVRTEAFLLATEYQIEEEEKIITEGIVGKIIDAIKGFFNKAIKFLIELWKKIVEIAKKAWNWIKNFIDKVRGKKTKSPEKSVKVAFVSESLSVKEGSVNKLEELASKYMKATQSINNTIEKQSKDNINFMKKFQNVAVRGVKEQYELDIVEEKIAYDTVQAQTLARDAIEKAYEKLKKDSKIKNVDKLKDVATKVDSSRSGRGDIGIVLSASSLFDMAYTIIDDKNMNNLLEAISEAQNDTLKLYDKLAHGEFMKAMELKIDTKELEKQISIYRTLANKFADEGGLSDSEMKQCEEAANKANSMVMSLKNVNLVTFEIRKAVDNLIEAEPELKNNPRFLIEFVKNAYFPNFDDCKNDEERSAAIRRWARLKINYNKHSAKLLTSMLKLNQLAFNISASRYAAIESAGEKGDVSVISETAEIIYENMDKFWYPDSLVLDLTSLGLASIHFSPNANTDFNGLMNPTVKDRLKWLKRILSEAARYDIIIYSHGSQLERDEVDKEKFDSWVEHGWVSKEKLEVNKGKVEITDDIKEKIWVMEPVMVYGLSFTLVPDLVDWLVEQKGFKRIKINNCNPGKIPLAKRYRDRKDLLISMAADTKLINK